MFCNRRGDKSNEPQTCRSSRRQAFSRKPQNDLEKSLYEDTSAVSDSNGKKTIRVFVIVLTVAVILSVLVIVYFTYQANHVWDNYLDANPIQVDARSITYSVNENPLSEFLRKQESQNISISNQIFDIDADGEEELIQISLEQESNDNIEIYPKLNIVEKAGGSYITNTYDFRDTRCSISPRFSADYYIYRHSQSGIYAFVSKVVAPETSEQVCTAGSIREGDASVCGYYSVLYPDGSLECYDLIADELLLEQADYDSASALDSTYLISNLSTLRTLFAREGLKGFLTGTDDIDNIENFNDLTLIGSFAVRVDEQTGNLEYTDLLPAKA